jgi:hypothetical protein
VRSSKNLNALIKNNVRTKTTMRKYLEFLEDKSSGRVGAQASKSFKMIEKSIKKLVPENFKISLFPSYFNTTDCERIGTILKDNLVDFLLNTTKKVMFSISIRVFNYSHQVNSVRVAIVKMYPSETLVNNPTAGKNPKATTPIKSPLMMEFDDKSKHVDGEYDSNTKLIKNNNDLQDVPPNKRFE